MAFDAAEIYMSAVKMKVCVNVVIERRDQPVVAAMARIALVAEATLVWIVVAVTAGTVACRVVKAITLVARAAGDCRVQAS